MTLYATRADLAAKPWGRDLPLLADFNQDGEEDDGAVDAALASASAEVESKVSSRTDLGLAPPYPRKLVDVTCDLARYFLYAEPPEPVTKRYNDAIKLLIAVRDGLESFGLDAAGNTVETPMLVDIRHQGNVFGRQDGTV